MNTKYFLLYLILLINSCGTIKNSNTIVEIEEIFPVMVGANLGLLRAREPNSTKPVLGIYADEDISKWMLNSNRDNIACTILDKRIAVRIDTFELLPAKHEEEIMCHIDLYEDHDSIGCAMTYIPIEDKNRFYIIDQNIDVGRFKADSAYRSFIKEKNIWMFEQKDDFKKELSKYGIEHIFTRYIGWTYPDYDTVPIDGNWYIVRAIYEIKSNNEVFYLTILQKSNRFYKMISYEKEGDFGAVMMVDQRYEFHLELLPKDKQEKICDIFNNKNRKFNNKKKEIDVITNNDQFNKYIEKAETLFYIDYNLNGIDIKTHPLWWHLPLPQ